jgi:hypothetical protein
LNLLSKDIVLSVSDYLKTNKIPSRRESLVINHKKNSRNGGKLLITVPLVITLLLIIISSISTSSRFLAYAQNCSPGYGPDPDDPTRCVPLPNGPPASQTQTCPDGSVIDASKTCPKPQTQTCPDGSVIDASKTCPPSTQPTPPTPPAPPGGTPAFTTAPGNTTAPTVGNASRFTGTTGGNMTGEPDLALLEGTSDPNATNSTTTATLTANGVSIQKNIFLTVINTGQDCNNLQDCWVADEFKLFVSSPTDPSFPRTPLEDGDTVDISPPPSATSNSTSYAIEAGVSNDTGNDELAKNIFQQINFNLPNQVTPGTSTPYLFSSSSTASPSGQSFHLVDENIIRISFDHHHHHHHGHHHRHHVTMQVSLSPGCTGEIRAGHSEVCHISITVGQPAQTGGRQQRTGSPSLVVLNYVNNRNGGTAHAQDFHMGVKWQELSRSTPRSPVSFPGTQFGHLVHFSTSSGVTYQVTQNSMPGYHLIQAHGCAGTINASDIAICTVVNDDSPHSSSPPRLTVTNHVVNNNGGASEPTAFFVHVADSGGHTHIFRAYPNGYTVNLPEGTYRVTETGPPHYSLQMTGQCTGTIHVGNAFVCHLINHG